MAPSAERFDAIVLGAGAMGLYAVARLSDMGLRVACVEVADTQHESLRTRVSTSGGHRGTSVGWTAGLGGTTQWWGGQLWPWDAMDFRAVGVEGGVPWEPSVARNVSGAYGVVQRRLGLSGAHDKIHQGALAARQENGGLRRGRLRHSSWMDRRERQFVLNRELRRDRHSVRLIWGTVEKVEPANPRSWTVVLTSPDGSKSRIQSSRVVLAAGTLGNVSILARSEVARGLPLGEGFTDHVSVPVADFVIRDLGAFRRVAAPQLYRGVLASPRLLPDSGSGTTEGFAHWEVVQPDWFDLPRAKRALRSRSGSDALGVVRAAGPHLAPLLGSVTSGFVQRHRPVVEGSRVRLRVDIQQGQRPDNRLTYDDESDTLEVRWSVGEVDRRAAQAVGAAILSDLDLDAVGLSLSTILDGDDVADTFHLMGGTVMGKVVDAQSRLMCDEGFLIAGASNFPSGGLANPTLTALALLEVSLREYAAR